MCNIYVFPYKICSYTDLMKQFSNTVYKVALEEIYHHFEFC